MLQEYINISVFFVISGILAFVIFFLSYVLSDRESGLEKLSAYECGFDPFNDAREQFDIKFYLVSILFIIFDLEATFLFPWAICLNQVGDLGFWSIFDFFFELTIGFFYVWRIGALDWRLYLDWSSSFLG